MIAAHLWRRRHDDDGSIILALLGVVVVSGLLSVGLATIITAHTTARHDFGFEAALTGAEEGMSGLVGQIRANPTAVSFAPVTGTDPTTGVDYTATATASGGSWLVDATGTAHIQSATITRHIQVTVNVEDLLDVPLFGDTALTLGGDGDTGSSVDRYDSGAGADASDVCDQHNQPVSMAGSADTRMCYETSPPHGAAATNGALTMRSQDLGATAIAEADIFHYPIPGAVNGSASGACLGDSGVCSQIGGRVVTHDKALVFPPSSVCSQGIGGGATAYDGSLALAANAVYNFTNVTLNATAIANLSNLSGSRIIICFSGTLVVPPLVALNSQAASSNSSLRDPRPPSTLLLIGTGSAPVVQFGDGGQNETSLSAVVYAPTASCSSAGHVDVYGLLVCGSVNAPKGLDVHYDRQIDLTTSFDRPVVVSDWREL